MTLCEAVQRLSVEGDSKHRGRVYNLLIAVRQDTLFCPRVVPRTLVAAEAASRQMEKLFQHASMSSSYLPSPARALFPIGYDSWIFSPTLNPRPTRFHRAFRRVVHVG
jgi:hypothetical protein